MNLLFPDLSIELQSKSQLKLINIIISLSWKVLAFYTYLQLSWKSLAFHIYLHFFK